MMWNCGLGMSSFGAFFLQLLGHATLLLLNMTLHKSQETYLSSNDIEYRHPNIWFKTYIFLL